MNIIKNFIRRQYIKNNPLEEWVLQVDHINEIKKIFDWNESPDHIRQDMHDFKYIEDINERRIRDVEVISTVACNVSSSTILEIGTSTGLSTVLFAQNSPGSHIFTINIPSDQIQSGIGGKKTTITLEKNEIGREYKKLKLANVTQIYENSKTWKPDIGLINIAFIDGCHDSDFVYNDTLKALKNMASGGIIMWHDFNPDLRYKFNWINDVCTGIEKLYNKGHLKNRIFLLKNSWVGLYQIPYFFLKNKRPNCI